MIYRVLADIVLLTHVAFVAFVLIGQILIFAGLLRGWNWVRGFGFRLVHLLAIGIVVAQAWAGVICPLTILENYLRQQIGDSVYPGTFVTYWLQRVLYYEAPPWVFTLCYSLFGLLVLGCFLFGPPRRPKFLTRRVGSQAQSSTP